MEFALSEDQKQFQDSVKGYLEKASGLEVVREYAAGKSKVAKSITDGLAELGATQILIPESHEGLGLGVLDAALVQEALGQYVSPAHYMASSAMAAIGIASAGTEDQKTEFLPEIASGKLSLGVAVSERVGARMDAGITLNDGKLSGKSLFMLEADHASHFLIADKEGALHLVEAGAKGVTQNSLSTIDKSRQFTELQFDNTPSTLLSGENQTGAAADKMISAGRILLAADTLGAAQVMIEKAVAYSLERKQFNRTIGSFQAVKHMCAEMAAKLEPARALVWHAAYIIDTDPAEAALMACLAKSHIAEVGKFIARTSIEVYGGMGFTDLVGLHYWFKRIGANHQLLGGPEALRAEAAKLQGWV